MERRTLERRVQLPASWSGIATHATPKYHQRCRGSPAWLPAVHSHAAARRIRLPHSLVDITYVSFSNVPARPTARPPSVRVHAVPIPMAQAHASPSAPALASQSFNPWMHAPDRLHCHRAYLQGSGACNAPAGGPGGLGPPGRGAGRSARTHSACWPRRSNGSPHEVAPRRGAGRSACTHSACWPRRSNGSPPRGCS